MNTQQMMHYPPNHHTSSNQHPFKSNIDLRYDIYAHGRTNSFYNVTEQYKAQPSQKVLQKQYQQAKLQKSFDSQQEDRQKINCLKQSLDTKTFHTSFSRPNSSCYSGQKPQPYQQVPLNPQKNEAHQQPQLYYVNRVLSDASREKSYHYQRQVVESDKIRVETEYQPQSNKQVVKNYQPIQNKPQSRYYDRPDLPETNDIKFVRTLENQDMRLSAFPNQPYVVTNRVEQPLPQHVQKPTHVRFTSDPFQDPISYRQEREVIMNQFMKNDEILRIKQKHTIRC